MKFLRLIKILQSNEPKAWILFWYLIFFTVSLQFFIYGLKSDYENFSFYLVAIPIATILFLRSLNPDKLEWKNIFYKRKAIFAMQLLSFLSSVLVFLMLDTPNNIEEIKLVCIFTGLVLIIHFLNALDLYLIVRRVKNLKRLTKQKDFELVVFYIESIKKLPNFNNDNDLQYEYGRLNVLIVEYNDALERSRNYLTNAS